MEKLRNYIESALNLEFILVFIFTGKSRYLTNNQNTQVKVLLIFMLLVGDLGSDLKISSKLNLNLDCKRFHYGMLLLLMLLIIGVVLLSLRMVLTLKMIKETGSKMLIIILTTHSRKMFLKYVTNMRIMKFMEMTLNGKIEG